MTMFEAVHPLEGGAFRRKARRERRYGLPCESPLRFYPRLAAEILGKVGGYWRVYRRAKAILDEIMADPNRRTYSDLAIAPPAAGEFDTLDLYHRTSGGEAALARKRRDDLLRAKVA